MLVILTSHQQQQLPALGGSVINVIERGRGAYISLCISVMYMGEIRGGGQDHENYPFLLSYIHCRGII